MASVYVETLREFRVHDCGRVAEKKMEIPSGSSIARHSMARLCAESEGRMNLKSIWAVALGATLFAVSPARAAGCKKDGDCGSGQTCSKGTCVLKAATTTIAPTSDQAAATKRTGNIAWAGLGFYSVSGSGAFALHVGGSANLMPLTPDLPLIGWADVGIGFPSGATVFPLKLGAGVRYDKAGPFQLLGGAAFTVMPTTASVTGVGIALMGMALYPLPQVSRNLSAQAQIGYDILSNGLGTFEFTLGAGWAL
jgi:hypothetical protein